MTLVEALDRLESPRIPYTFGRFALSPASRELRDDGKPAAIGARAFDVLQALIERRDRLVTKSELLDIVWPGVVVEENNLQVQISALRKLLGANVIATIPGRGYRFTGTLDGASDAPARDGAARDADVAARAASGPRRLTNLPAALPPLYGRDADVAALEPMIGAHRLVTVVGAGGIGKSRLAQAAAHASKDRWPDGAWMVELAGLADPALVANAVAQALDLQLLQEGVPRDELVDALSRRSLLLVLDNCEHLLDAVTDLAQAIVLRAPGVTVLATSQEPLRLPVEQQYRVAPLAVPAQTSPAEALAFGAVALFDARVRAVDAAFRLDDETLPWVVDICRRLDGLPLAVELAAARVGTIGLRAVRDKLDARFRLLTGGARATLRRHQTLRAALEWSHNLLNADEQAVFRRLGVFAGGFTMEMAQAVARDARLDEWDVLDLLSALVEKSLVVADAADPPRYRLLESARAFALEQLADVETSTTLERHAHALRDFVTRVDDANLDGELRTDQYAALVLPELDNLRAAHAWAAGDGRDVATATAIAAHAGSLIDYTSECAAWLTALPIPDGSVLPPAVEARYWRAIGAQNMTGHVPRDLQIDAARRACALYEKLGHPRRVFSSLIHLARHTRLHEPETAKAAIDEARRRLQPDWPAEFHIVLLRFDSYAAQMTGRIDEAVALYREGLRRSAAAGDWRLEVIAHANLVDILWLSGDREGAAREGRALVGRLHRRPAAYGDMNVVYANLFGVLSELGELDEAGAVAREGLPYMRHEARYFVEEWMYYFWRRGELDVAAQLLGACDAAQARGGAPYQPNEQRLVDAARPALLAALGAEGMARHATTGAALTPAEMGALLGAALARSA